MLDKITIPSLSTYYTSLHFQDENTSIHQVLNSFFALVLENHYKYEITKREELFNEESQHVTIKIIKPNIGVGGPIGTVTLEFSENTVSMVSSSNSVVSTIMVNSDSQKISRQVAADDAFLRLGYSFECFRQAWLLKSSVKKQLEHEAPLLAMSFFGTITETASPHELSDLIYEIVLALEPRESWSWVEDNPEWKNRSSIINILTNYISTGNISRQDISNMRNAASMLEGTNANTFRKLSVAGIVISPLVITGAAAGLVALNTIFLPFGIIATITIFLSVVAFVAGASYLGKYSSTQKPDFLSNAVFFLANKIEETLPPEDHSPPIREVSNNQTIILNQKVLLPQSHKSPLVQAEVKAQLNFNQLFEKLCEDTLKPVLEEIYEEGNLDEKIYKDLKDGIGTQINDRKLNTENDITELKNQIDQVVKITDKNTRLSRLYEVCGVQKPQKLQPF